MSDPRFPSSTDATAFAYWNTEIYNLMFRRVMVFPYTTDKQNPDNLYGEDMGEKWLEEDSYETPCYIADLPGWKTKVTPQGVDESRPLTLCFNKNLIEASGKPLPVTGFLIYLQNEYYRVMQENPIDYFANTDQTFTHIVLVQRYRTESVSRGEVKGDHQP